MSRQLRISHVVVKPVVVWDDGEELSPGPDIQPVSVPVSALAGLAERFPAELANIAAQADRQPDA